jgi:hypothetical protein
MKFEVKSLVITFIALWLISFYVFRSMGDWQTANNIGGSFGAVSALFSGVALAMAIYSMVLQQKQSREFEQSTLHAEKRTIDVLTQQSRAIALIESSLVQQVHAGRVAALTFMVERQEQRIESLRDWGRNSFKDEKHYQGGIDAARRKIDELESEIRKIVGTT